MVVSY